MLTRWFAAAVSRDSKHRDTQITIHDVDIETYDALPGELVRTTVRQQFVEFKRLRFGRLVFIFAPCCADRDTVEAAAKSPMQVRIVGGMVASDPSGVRHG